MRALYKGAAPDDIRSHGVRLRLFRSRQPRSSVTVNRDL